MGKGYDEYDRCERMGPGQGKPSPYIKGIWHQIRDEIFYAMGNEILR